MMNALTPVAYNTLFAVIALLFVWLARRIADARTTTIDDDDEIENQSNDAIGMRRSGFYLGGMIAMAGVLTGPTQGLLNDVMGFVVYGALSYALLFGTREINDRVLLGAIDNDDECLKGNEAVGIAELGNYIATGLIINGCVSGDGGGMLAGIISTIVFFVIGQIILLALVYAYETITDFDCIPEIAKGNKAAAMMIAGKSIALGIILRSSIVGPTQGWATDIKSFALSAITGIVLLLVLNKLVDKLLLPNTNLHQEVSVDQNVAAVRITQTATIGLAIIISTVV